MLTSQRVVYLKTFHQKYKMGRFLMCSSLKNGQKANYLICKTIFF